MPDRPRPVVRALILDEVDRALLVRFDLPDVRLWATPGGGVGPGEDEEAALRREIAEETGLRGFEIGPLIWTRSHEFTIEDREHWQYERIFLVRTEHFEPVPGWSREELASEGITSIRWWTVDEMYATDVTLAPARMPELVSRLIAEGLPAVPVDAGV